ncbi:MarR family winged helix-turn-helix transcriptional regulator [Paenibacillus sp. YYML68]|uniref:MarR family winged helix-turn-helix transcriptional regulator n=1 Tax=Paenibacillus sp. YYML68 TaxID=2909250 RepID=UPI00248FBFEA|nr:MarR family transcriptional regulator [Paenibacillus sp. YYML68]
MAEKKYTIPRWISLLYRYGQMYMGDRLEKYGIGRGQFMFLNALYWRDGLSQEELSEHLCIDKGTTARALKKLEEQGYIYREVRAEDRRYYSVYLTPRAMEIKDEVRAVIVSWRSVLTDGLSEEELEIALELLDRMGANAERQMKLQWQQEETDALPSDEATKEA